MFNIFTNTGNTLGTAINLTPNTQSLIVGSLNSFDPNDFYRINLSGRSSLNLTLSSFSGNADVQIIRDINSNLSIDFNEIINGSYLAGATTDLIKTTLEVGQYFIRIYQPGTGATTYSANVSTQLINTAPSVIQFKLSNSNLRSGDTLSAINGLIFDGDGGSDIAKIDFRIRTSSGAIIDIPDNASITSDSFDRRRINFSYNQSLDAFNLATGNYSLLATAIDKAGASVSTERAFTFTRTNTAPNSLQFQINKASYNNTETINVSSGWVYDANGATDIARVDFKIRRVDGSFVEIADATNITPLSSDNRWGRMALT